jgi:hypothetical protein
MQGNQIAFIEAFEQAQAHRRRCKTLPPLRPGESERLMTAFLAVKSVTVCPARYAAPVEQRPQLTRDSF